MVREPLMPTGSAALTCICPLGCSSGKVRALARGGRWRSAIVASGAALTALWLASPAAAQTSGIEEAPVLRGISLTPSVQVTDIGYDDNVFRVDKRANPVGDFTFTASPSARLLLGMPRLRVESQGTLDFIYFKEIASVRSIDANAYARVEVPLARVTPYVGVDWVSARHRRNFEIDLPVRRVDLSTNAGVDVALSPKTSAGVMTRWSRVDYSDDTIYLGTDLEQFLGATARSNGARVRYAATPLTTVGAEVERDTSEFAAVPARNSTGFRVTSVVEFRPLALVSGRAQVGFRKRSFVDGAA